MRITCQMSLCIYFTRPIASTVEKINTVLELQNDLEVRVDFLGQRSINLKQVLCFPFPIGSHIWFHLIKTEFTQT